MSPITPVDPARSQPWRMVARGAWLALFALQLVVFIGGMMVWFPILQHACRETLALCLQRGQLTVADAQAFAEVGWSLDQYAWYSLLTRVAQKLLGIFAGVLIFWRKPDDRMSWIASVFLITGLESTVADVLVAVVPQWALPARFLSWTGLVSIGFFFYLFPSGRFVPGWTRWAAIGFSALFFFSRFFQGTSLDVNQYGPPGAMLGGLFFVTFLGAQLYRLRFVSAAIERQQTKWVVLAVVIGIVTLLAALSIVVFENRMGERDASSFVLVDLGFSALSYLLPVAIGFAVLRYRLFEIDVIIRRTLTYALLTGTLALIYFGSVVFLESALRTVTGETSEAAIVISTLLIAALFGPLRRRVQRFIDKRLYRQRYDAQKTLSEFGARLRERHNAEIEALSREFLGVIQETVQPSHVSLWLKEPPILSKVGR